MQTYGDISNSADLDGSEAFMVDQTVNCLSLFALSCGEYALAADTSRYVLKRQEGRADAGIWIMRGLSFAGMGKCDTPHSKFTTALLVTASYLSSDLLGVPFLARLHFTSALSVNADYAGLQECLPIVEAECASYARRITSTTKSVSAYRRQYFSAECFSCWYVGAGVPRGGPNGGPALRVTRTHPQRGAGLGGAHC
jgi:hypothetical protein